jgi:hypothetical protein
MQQNIDLLPTELFNMLSIRDIKKDRIQGKEKRKNIKGLKRLNKR